MKPPNGTSPACEQLKRVRVCDRFNLYRVSLVGSHVPSRYLSHAAALTCSLTVISHVVHMHAHVRLFLVAGVDSS